MFRQLRRKNKEISIEEIEALLINERRGVLAMNGDDGYPYAVPINYIYDKEENKIFFHGSKIGHKADAIKNNDKVCFTVYGDETIKDEAWAPYLKSVVIFGRCKMIDSLDLLKKFANKYYPNEELIDEEINKTKNAVQMYEIEIEHLSGKQIQEK